ncbi:hypothetical protein B566_EDAN015067 [Ephemera danica]|nr:hypothetical protein B566_EDAN015067 [Ephemera danica]
MIGRRLISISSPDSPKWCALKSIVRAATTAAAQSIPMTDDSGVSQKLPFFRTNESSPVNHTKLQSGKFYTIDPHIRKLIFLHGGVPKPYAIQTDTFNEMCFMVRNPALEIISYLKSANYSDPAIRYVIFPNWFWKPKECADSMTQEGFVDLPLDAAAWLIHFKTQNAVLLEKLQLTVSQEYLWSKREVTPKGAPLSDLIELGISRIKYSSDCVAAVLKEVKQYTELGRCKTLVALDGFNIFFYPNIKIRLANKTLVSPDRVSLTRPFLEMTKIDWSNAAVVGFEHLDPFIPVQVEPYTEKELESCLAYYADRKWITNSKGLTEEGKKELAFLSARIPRELMNICAAL